MPLTGAYPVFGFAQAPADSSIVRGESKATKAVVFILILHAPRARVPPGSRQAAFAGRQSQGSRTAHAPGSVSADGERLDLAVGQRPVVDPHVVQRALERLVASGRAAHAERGTSRIGEWQRGRV